MIHIVLVEPEIPPNTGNIARTCAATATPLHLVEPLGFSISDKNVKRAGLDYWKDLDLHVHRDFATFSRKRLEGKSCDVALLSTKGERRYTEIVTPSRDTDLYILFGPETRGLSPEVLAAYPERRYRIPMIADQRSLNLSNAVAIVIYDLLGRIGFAGFR